MTDLFCLWSSEGQQVRPRARLQHGALTESNTAGPHRVHHLTTTFAQIPQTDPHVPSLTAPAMEGTKTDGSCSSSHISKSCFISTICLTLNSSAVFTPKAVQHFLAWVDVKSQCTDAIGCKWRTFSPRGANTEKHRKNDWIFLGIDYHCQCQEVTWYVTPTQNEWLTVALKVHFRK